MTSPSVPEASSASVSVSVTPSALADVQRHIATLSAERARRGQPLSGRVVHVAHYLPLTAALLPSPVASKLPAPSASAVPSPPLTPPVRAADVDAPPFSADSQTQTPAPASAPEHDAPKWTLAPRAGHSAMVSGILGLAAGTGATEQVVVGWVGDLYRQLPAGVVPGAASGEPGTPALSALDIHAASPTTSTDALNTPMDPEAGGDAPPDARGFAKLPAKQVGDAERKALEEAIAAYTPPEDSTSAYGEQERKKVSFVPVWLEDDVAHGHYDGYCKTTLWPLFHYLLWQDVASVQPSPASHWEYYQAANAAYAAAVTAVLQPGDLVWVHDYHLLLVPSLIRETISSNPPPALLHYNPSSGNEQHSESESSGSSGYVNPDPNADIATGLFVHTPFPSSEIFRCLPARRQVLDGMLGADLVAFQTYAYARHFVSCCVRVCGYENVGGGGFGGPAAGGVSSNTMGIDVQGRVTAVGYVPVGVDAPRIERDVLRPGIQPKLAALRALYEGKKIIVARDKLDLVKGVVQKLRAFERLLIEYPEWVGKVVLIQVTSPALTDSPRLERQVSELVAHINGAFGALDFVPVHHYHQTIRKDEFYALLSAADLALITPLRDGMNTTSMEFVLAQERVSSKAEEGAANASASEGDSGALTRDPAPLVLSEFMGITSAMSDALLVNPWDLGGVAAAVDRGLKMSSEEKRTRHKALLNAVRTHTSRTWAASLVRMLLERGGGAGEDMAHATPYLDVKKMESMYRKAGKRLFLFDYDGTLTPIVKTPSAAIPSADALRALQLLSADPKNVVYIISGRDAAFLEQHWGSLKNIGLSAEHGGFLRLPGEGRWINLTERLDMSWMSEVEEMFRYFTERTTGSHIEIKKSSITWHYRSADPEWGAFQCRQCQDLLAHNLARTRPIEVLLGKKNLEVRPLAVNKGEIVRQVVRENARDVEFVFCAGDDKTDEDMFRALKPFGMPSAASGAGAGLGETSSTGEGEQQQQQQQQQELVLRPEGVFATTVGASSKKTLARWHVTSPAEVVEAMLALVEGPNANKEGEIEKTSSPPEVPVPTSIPVPAPTPVLATAEQKPELESNSESKGQQTALKTQTDASTSLHTLVDKEKSKSKASRLPRESESDSQSQSQSQSEPEGKRRKRRRMQHVTVGVFGVALGVLGTWIRGKSSAGGQAAAASAVASGSAGAK